MSNQNILIIVCITIMLRFWTFLIQIITKLVIKNKLKELVNELKKFKVQTILVLHYKETNDFKIFHSSAKLLDIDEAFKSMHQSIMVKNCTKMKFSIMEFFSKCNQIHNFLLIWQHLLKKSLMENFSFCAVKNEKLW